MISLIAVPGSLRAGSYNRMIARAATELAPPGSVCELADLVRDLPNYDEDADRDPLPGPVAELRRRIVAADGVLLVTPEYNYGLPGGVKNLVDWASRPFAAHSLVGKPVAVIGSSPGSRGGRAAVEYLRMVLPAVGAQLVGAEVMVGKVTEHLDSAAGSLGEELAGHVSAALQELVDAAQRPAPTPAS